MVFVALSHYYLSDRGNVLALFSINPSPRATIRVSSLKREKLAKIFLFLRIKINKIQCFSNVIR